VLIHAHLLASGLSGKLQRGFSDGEAQAPWGGWSPTTGAPRGRGGVPVGPSGAPVQKNISQGPNTAAEAQQQQQQPQEQQQQTAAAATQSHHQAGRQAACAEGPVLPKPQALTWRPVPGGTAGATPRALQRPPLPRRRRGTPLAHPRSLQSPRTPQGPRAGSDREVGGCGTPGKGSHRGPGPC